MTVAVDVRVEWDMVSCEYYLKGREGGREGGSQLSVLICVWTNWSTRKEKSKKRSGEREEGQRLMFRPVVNQTDTWC